MRAWESVIAVAVLLAIPERPGAADAAVANLQPWTTGAYEAYVASAEVAFLTRIRSGEPVAEAAGASTVGQTTDGRIVEVPNGLVHHWRGTIHVPGVGLERVIAPAQRYDAYTRLYKSVVEARLLHRDGDRFCVLTRYLWRINTFTRFVERAGGVDVELETIGLSRRFPRMLGWLIEPIARRLGQRSVERTLTEFGLAVRADLSEPVPTAAGTPRRVPWPAPPPIPSH